MYDLRYVLIQIKLYELTKTKFTNVSVASHLLDIYSSIKIAQVLDSAAA